MRENEWMVSENPFEMMRLLLSVKDDLSGTFRPSTRKLSLWAAACWRMIEPHSGIAEGRAVDVEAGIKDWRWMVENMTPDSNCLKSHRRQCQQLSPTWAALLRCVVGNPWRPVTLPIPDLVSDMNSLLLDKSGQYTISRCTYHPKFDGSYNPAGMEKHYRGKPFWDGSRPVCEDCWRVFMTTASPMDRERMRAAPWLTPTVVNLARAAYEDRCPASTMIALADALEEAGCDNADVLSHLRGEPCPFCKNALFEVNALGTPYLTGPDSPVRRHAMERCACGGTRKSAAVHARGCWVLDTVLGKE